ncbi:hypothetical protein EPR50_G00129170 [Perca flavescens]|uniref:Uncharacterized protein n=1 Tax=Perca flavescens TaxID=8167 RepID=A0A484CR43_PERFV|nr:hypothetical protein EPR50_G00129170 [Perca flavescens]
MGFTTAGFCSYCRDLKERIHLFGFSDAQPCRMTHNGRNGTDVNRGRAQRPAPSDTEITEEFLRRVGPTLAWLGAMRG